MIRYLTSVIFFTMILSSCRTGKSALENITSGGSAGDRSESTDFMEPSSWLLGYLSPVQFTRSPYSEWYLEGYDSYQPVAEIMGKLDKISKDNISIQIVLGTWCPDSRREVPRFMKILDLWGFPVEKVTFIGTDNTKLAPVGDYDKLEIERVPTFIILENKIESGRIIENPVTSLEQDMLNILTGNQK